MGKSRSMSHRRTIRMSSGCRREQRDGFRNQSGVTHPSPRFGLGFCTKFSENLAQVFSGGIGLGVPLPS
jgi:hypothetical protein